MPQFLIRFQDSTHVVAADDENDLETHILQSIATQTGWSVAHLQCCWLDPPFGTVRVVSSLRGGKGGFGTLLKGQSRQAGAKATTNFGACRDLQGRRLRHVNQAVEQSIWMEWQEKIKAGTATQEDLAKALALNTDSGLVGWHLQLPSWTDVSVSKEQRKWKRKFWRWKREQEAVDAAKQEKRRVQEQQVQSYVQAAQEASSLVQSNLQTALQEGIAQQQKRIKVQPDPPTALLTLAGDVTLAFENDKWQIQSQSNFCTVGIILQQQQQPQKSVYFEIAVVTGGIVQVGWATPRFKPSCESGDGVGDCNQSWAYDGSRQIRLHGGSEESFGKEWKAGDVVGCHLHERKVSYSLNGQDCGVAFTLSQQMGPVFPAISCNPGEIVELHLYPQEQKYQPTGSVAIGDILAQEDVSLPVEGELSDEEIKEDTETKPPAKRAAETPPVQEQQPSKQEPALIVEPLDLDQYESVEELEALGLDRLKGALMAIQVKCGGTLHERAARLFSLKGLAPKDYPPKLRAKRKGSNL